MIQPGHPRHVFFEELKELASQTPRNKWHRRSTDAIDSFCTMGRNYGYGYTVIGQRTAIMAKGPLNQAGALFAMRLQGTQDIGSIMEWIENNGPDLESFGGLKAFKKELTKLEKGEAFYVNPSDVQPLVKIKVGPRETMHPAEAMRVNSKVLKTALMTDIRGFADKLAKELTKTVIQVVPGPDLPEKRSKTKREAGPFPVPPVDRTSKEEERLLRENGELRQEVQKLREAVANEQRAAKSAEARLGAVREALRPQYDALRGLFEQLLVGPSDGAVDRGPYGKWLSKAPAAGIRSMLEYLLDNGEATRQQLSTIAGVSTRSGYDYIGWMKRNNLVESNGQKIVLRRI